MGKKIDKPDEKCEKILQAEGSYVVLDPDGSIMERCGESLREKNYYIRCLNLEKPEYSSGYNPFSYLLTCEDVTLLSKTLIEGTAPVYTIDTLNLLFDEDIETIPDSKNSDNWKKAETAILSSVIGFIWHYAEPEEKTMSNVMSKLKNIIAHGKARSAPLNKFIKNIDSNTPGVSQYIASQINLCKQLSGDNVELAAESVLLRLQIFETPGVQYMTEKDEIAVLLTPETNQTGRNAAIFIYTSGRNMSVNLIYTTFITQLKQYLLRTKSIEQNEEQIQFLLEKPCE